jgi:Cohesin domain
MPTKEPRSTHYRLRRQKLAIFCVALAVITSFLSTSAEAQGASAVVRVTAPSKASTAAGDISVLINVSNVKNIGGFEFVLTVDSKVLTPVSVVKGEFLGSSGREVFCSEPTIDSASLLFRCVTLRSEPAGADGSGTLGMVTLKPAGAGSSDLALSHVRLLEPDGTEIPTTTEDSKLAVSAPGRSSANIALIGGGIAAGAIVVVAAGAFVVRRRRSTASAPSV